MACLCVIDDDVLMRESLTEALQGEDHRVVAFGDPVEALERIRKGGFDLVLCDLKMPGMDGVSLIREIRVRDLDLPVVLMTAYATVRTAVEALKLGAFDYVQKPFELEAICVLIERALQNTRLRKDNEALRTSLQDLTPSHEMVGTSEPMESVRRQIAKLAASDATVLITGESGTGKELAARAIHRASLRRDRPMLCLNCAALSSNLMESELFGHERGAFTGADRMRKGRFELADGGTLLLDEISEMALPLQAKFLRVLQEGEFERVGSSVTRRANVRVLATTNRNLADCVNRNRFRQDLYYRLDVLPINLPKLSERCDDIPEMVAGFLEGIAKRLGKPVTSFTPDAITLLTDHSWPGNVRELENMCERAVAMTTGTVVEASTIRPWIRGAAELKSDPSMPLRHGRLLEDSERQLITRTLRQYRGHRAKTAKALGMGLRTLGMRLKQWREEAESVGQEGRTPIHDFAGVS